MVIDVRTVTVVDVTLKLTLVWPAVTPTVAGTLATVPLLLDAVIESAEGAAALKLMVPENAGSPPTMLVRLSESPLISGTTVRDGAETVLPPYAALIVVVAFAVIAWPVIANVALLLPAATATLAGTVAAAVLLLVNVTVMPPAGAALVSVTVPVPVAEATSGFGLTLTDEINGTTVRPCVRVCVTAPDV